MITDGLQSWVLHKRWSGDTSAQVTFFTREQGVISALSKGGRTPQKQSLLHEFTPGWLSVDTRRDWHYVRQLDVLAPSLVLAGDSLFAGLYVNEIIYHGLRQLDPCPLLFDAYVQTLQLLTQTSHRMDIEAVLRRFEWQFLSSCGYAFSLTQEAFTQQVVLPDNNYDFIAGEGVIKACKGIPGRSLLAMANDDKF